MPADIESIAVTVNKSLNRQVPWWGLGQSFANYESDLMTSEEALIKAGLDWNVTGGEQVFRQNPTTGVFEPIEGYQVISRDLDHKVFNVAGRLYNPFQNHEMLSFGDTLVDEFGAKWDSVGSLMGGRKVFATFKLADVSIKVGGVESEKLETYLLLSNSHDGSGSFRIDIVNIRTVCTNTYHMALAGALSSFSIRHVGSLNARVEEARRALDITTRHQAKLNEVATRLAESEAEANLVLQLIADLVPLPEKKGRGQAEEKREGLLNNILGSPTIPKDLRQTKWGVFAGVTEFFEHEDQGKFKKATPVAERRMLTTLFGGAVEKARSTAWARLTA